MTRSNYHTVNPIRVLLLVIICQSAGLIGSIFTFQSINNWYVYLTKPSFTPPGWVFGPVWTTLYTLMGISLYLIWQRGEHKKEKRNAITLFIIQLILNSIWSIVFFGLHSTFFGLVIIIALELFIAATAYKFYYLNKLSAYLLLPYLVWVAFASYLNYKIWVLN